MEFGELRGCARAGFTGSISAFAGWGILLYFKPLRRGIRQAGAASFGEAVPLPLLPGANDIAFGTDPERQRPSNRDIHFHPGAT